MMEKNKAKYPGVYPYDKGRWRVHWYDWDGKRKTKVLTCTEKQADRWVSDKKVEVDRIKSGQSKIPGTISGPIKLKDLWTIFSEDYKLKVENRTIADRSYKRYVSSYFALKEFSPLIHNSYLPDITAEQFEKFKAYRLKKNYKPDGINTVLRNLKTIFLYAVNKGLIEKSPLQNVKKVKAPKKDVRYLTEDELKKLNKVLISIDKSNERDRNARDLIQFYLLTGARAKEILADSLKWKNITNETINLPVSKTDSIRTIPVSNGIKKILKRRDKSKSGPFDLTYNSVYSCIKNKLDEAGISNAAVHTLRKTAGALHYIANRDIFATSHFLGHSSVTITELHYVGLIQSLQREHSAKHDETVSRVIEI